MINWPATLARLHRIVFENTELIGDGYGHTDSLRWDFGIFMKNDQFHPISSGGDLQRALHHLPKRCDYRSLKSYWAWKEGRDNIADQLFYVLNEMGERIHFFFNDSWNFAPGYRLPLSVETPNWANIVDKELSKVIKASRS